MMSYSMYNIFSFCIFGNSLKYCKGLAKNLEQIQHIFPDWKVYIVVGSDVSPYWIDIYSSFSNVIIRRYDIANLHLMTYRFFGYDLPDVGIMICRDADSRFTTRDIWCINQFINSDYKMFTVRDHKYHQVPIMGGQWGIKHNNNINIENLYNKYLDTQQKQYTRDDCGYYQCDQDFLREMIYNTYADVTTFVAYSTVVGYQKETVKDIEIPRENIYDFCGNVIDYDVNGNEQYMFTIYGSV